MGKPIRLYANAPVTITFALLALAALVLGAVTDGWTTRTLFSVYRAPLSDPLTWVRMVGHVLGHSGYAHYIGNMMLLLVLGPTLEERYGSGSIAVAIVMTALVAGVVQMACFPDTALLGASGIVFMMILLSAFGGTPRGRGVPITLLLVGVLYLGGELWDAIFVRDNISQLSHILGGVCGTVFGFLLTRRGKG